MSTIEQGPQPTQPFIPEPIMSPPMLDKRKPEDQTLKGVRNPQPSDLVTWFSGGNPNAAPQLGYIVDSGMEKVVTIKLFGSGGIKTSVRHHDDNMTKLWPANTQQYGTWVYYRPLEDLRVEVERVKNDIAATRAELDKFKKNQK